MAEITRSVRQLSPMRSRLWGNDGHYLLRPISRKFEQELQNRLRKSDGVATLEIEPEFYWNVRDSLTRSLIDSVRQAILVRRQELRPLVREMIADEFPETPVLSTAELSLGVIARIGSDLEFLATESINSRPETVGT